MTENQINNRLHEGWGDNVKAGIIDGDLYVVPEPLIKSRVLTLDEIFNNGGNFRE